MLGAFLATFLFAVSAVSANRSVRHLGSRKANFLRLLVAVICLGMWAHYFGQGLGGASLKYFLLSGVIGFGFGDIGVFFALPLIGSRLTVLMTQTLAAPIAGVAEFAILGTTLSFYQIFFGLLILLGVSIALKGKIPGKPTGAILLLGLAFGLLAALGQGFGAVVSRMAYDVALTAGESIDGATAAYQRVLGGITVAFFFFIWKQPRKNLGAVKPVQTLPEGKKGRGIILTFILLNAFAGPILGVSAFQWALETQPSAVVLPIVALTPIAVMPLAWLMEGDRPSLTGIVGGLIAVGGAIGLSFFS